MLAYDIYLAPLSQVNATMRQQDVNGSKMVVGRQIVGGTMDFRPTSGGRWLGGRYQHVYSAVHAIRSE